MFRRLGEVASIDGDQAQRGFGRDCGVGWSVLEAFVIIGADFRQPFLGVVALAGRKE